MKLNSMVKKASKNLSGCVKKMTKLFSKKNMPVLSETERRALCICRGVLGSSESGFKAITNPEFRDVFG